jgi:hypothetical protein
MTLFVAAAIGIFSQKCRQGPPGCHFHKSNSKEIVKKTMKFPKLQHFSHMEGGLALTLVVGRNPNEKCQFFRV